MIHFDWHDDNETLYGESTYLVSPKIIKDNRALVKNVYPKNNFLISKPNHMLWVLKRTVSMRWFFWVPKTYVKIDGKKIFTILRWKFLFYMVSNFPMLSL